MKKYFSFGGLFILSLFLIGVGCVKSGASTIIGNADNTASATAAISAGIVVNQSNVKVFNVTGKNFAFSVTEIKVKKGDKVTINFSSIGGYHDLVVDEFKAATQKVQTGSNTSVTFTADKTGTYEYYCSVDSHRKMGMVGKLIVE